MTTTNVHRKTQSLLLIQRLLSLREGSSPLNVIVDSLEQSARPLVSEYIRQATLCGTDIIYVSFELLTRPVDVTHFVQASSNAIPAVQKAVRELTRECKRSLVIIDSIQHFLQKDPQFIAQLPALTSPSSNLLVVYHDGMTPNGSHGATATYSPSPFNLLTYLATTVTYVYSLAQAIAKHKASLLSRAEPSFGLGEEKDGVLAGYGANSTLALLVEMEHRRRSGRAAGLSFVLDFRSQGYGSRVSEPIVTLREDHEDLASQTEAGEPDNTQVSNATFSLDLTEKQRQARENVVLPYFDAQSGGGGGGRILYEMDREDDFDEEEDEI